MALELKDVQARMAAAHPEDRVRGTIFNGAVVALRAATSEQSKAAVLAELGNPKWSDLGSYPVTDYLRLTIAAMPKLLLKFGSLEASFFHIGHHSAATFLGSVLGRLLTGFGSGPQSLINKIGPGFKMVVTYGERTVDWTDERTAVVHYRGDFLVPAYHEGVLTAGVEALGGRNVSCRSASLGLLDTDYHIHWD